MHRRSRIALLLLIVLAIFASFPMANSANAQTTRRNQYPIVLVHGFSGWGRDEMLGFKYWGGFHDLQQELRNAGYPTHTAAVGPFSSNWDRAVELYAQIVGGRVDYGAAHSAKHGHARYGRTYTAMYPDWGKIDPATGQPRKVHLIAHSQGGQTSRVLAHLLAYGSPEEVAATPAAELSPLFNGQRKPWISGVITLASPHDGTSLAIGVTQLVPAAQQLIAFAGAANGLSGDPLFDFKLDHWGLKRNAGESFSSYSNRVWNSRIWYDTKDISAWDLSPDGAKELNAWVKASPDVYYFSVSTEKTFTGWLTGFEYAEPLINPLWAITTPYMGTYTRNETGKVRIDSSWWQNDGVVNTRSMRGPTLSSTDTIVNYNGTAQRGAWNHLGVKESYDHSDIIGIGIYYDVRPYYRSLAKMLGELPQ